MAKLGGLGVEEWVHQSIQESLRGAYRRNPDQMMARIRRIAQKSQFPTADIDEMLEQISRGYLPK